MSWNFRSISAEIAKLSTCCRKIYRTLTQRLMASLCPLKIFVVPTKDITNENGIAYNYLLQIPRKPLKIINPILHGVEVLIFPLHQITVSLKKLAHWYFLNFSKHSLASTAQIFRLDAWSKEKHKTFASYVISLASPFTPLPASYTKKMQKQHTQ